MSAGPPEGLSRDADTKEITKAQGGRAASGRSLLAGGAASAKARGGGRHGQMARSHRDLGKTGCCKRGRSP